MNRIAIIVFTLGMSVSRADELVLVSDVLTPIDLRVEIDGKPLAAIWADTFARMFAYFDRDKNGSLDATEAARLPSALALRHAMTNGFTPPIGSAPPFAELDPDGNGKVTAAELAQYYASAGFGSIRIGVGRLPASAALTDAILRVFDGKRTETEWKLAIDRLQRLDTNDDELIGAGELVPRTVYPGAAGTMPLSANFEKLKWLSTGDKETRRREATATWNIRFSATPERFTVASGRSRIEGWVTEGKMPGAAARRLLTEQHGQSGLSWLTPIADQNADGKLDTDELNTWLDLQEQIGRGQVLLTVLDAGPGLFEVLDTNHDGALSVRELRGAWKRFGEVGCLTDGAFDRTKLPQMLLFAVSQGYPQAFGSATRHGPAWYRAMDRNNDGDVSRREFTGPADVFDTLDVDHDGLLTVAEAERAMKR